MLVGNKGKKNMILTGIIKDNIKMMKRTKENNLKQKFSLNQNIKDNFADPIQKLIEIVHHHMIKSRRAEEPLERVARSDKYKNL